MSKYPLVSVIIPCYNYARYLPECLDSVLAQSYPSWECIIVDDGSEDDTREVALEYAKKDSRIGYLFQQNSGPNAARNLGVKESSGEYIQFIDADDALECEKIKIQVKLLCDNPEVNIVYSDSKIFDSDFISETNIKYSHPRQSGFGFEIGRYLLRNPIMVSSALIRRKLLEVLPLDTKYRLNEDWQYWVYCCDIGEYFLFDNSIDTLVKVRRHGGNSSKDDWKNFFVRNEMRNEFNRKLKSESLRELNNRYLKEEVDFLIHLSLVEIGRDKFKGLWRLLKVIQIKPKPRYILYFVLSWFLSSKSVSSMANWNIRAGE